MSEKKAINKIEKIINNHLNSPYGDEGECLTEEDRSLEKLAKKIYNSIEVDVADVEEAIGRTYIKLCDVPHINWVDKLAKAIADKKPIKIKRKP